MEDINRLWEIIYEACCRTYLLDYLLVGFVALAMVDLVWLRDRLGVTALICYVTYYLLA